MKTIVGILLVVLCTLASYAIDHGHIEVLWQPFEFIIILGSAVGAYVTGNPPAVLKRTTKMLPMVFKKPLYNKASYVELLSLLYQTFKLAKTKGMLALEPHIEKPEESSIFQAFPNCMVDHHVVEFFCDYLRLVTLGSDKPYELETLMDREIEVHHEEEHAVPHAIQTMADGMPALGIVAAVLGVIKTMGAISEPPEVLGHMIGGALVGTFFGVWVSYGYLAPLSNALKTICELNSKFYNVIKVGLLAHLSGYAPSISIEYARKAIDPELRPSFLEMEEATAALPAPGA
ncbi:MAG TPA: flagellar motor stator protein MotA [Alphaproteobacteria bacterium]|nr:flagellar motor stator protein MotA [Alphaproteobacteria bacterium]